MHRNTTLALLGLASAVAASFCAPAARAAEDGPVRGMYYYNGRRRVDVDLALDEVWVGGARLKDGTVRAVPDVLDPAGLDAKAAAMRLADARDGAVSAVLYRRSRASRDAMSRCILTDRVAVQLSDGTEIGPVMGKYGLELERVVPGMENTYILRVRDSKLTRSLEVANALYESGAARWANPVLRRLRSKRYTPTDPEFVRQWHLHNDGTWPESGAVDGNDINVTTAWDSVRGAGINIAIVDDGVDLKHPDLAPNARTDIDYDYWDNDENPTCVPPYDMHGTSVAGVAAARGGNDVGVSGAAPQASLVAVRLISGPTTDAEERDGLLHNATPAIAADATDISSNSWGPIDNGYTVEGPLPLAEQAFIDGTTNGRDGRGIIYTWAAGNGEESSDDSNYDGYANQRYTIAVAASNAAGMYSPYSEPGANILVNAPSSEETNNDYVYGITTTDVSGVGGYNSGDYTHDFGGTSSATPLVSGVVALILEANPLLGWRDVQEILLLTATKNDPTDTDWHTNGGGNRFHHHYGFGRVNATAAVAAANEWVNLPPEAAAPSYTYNELSGAIPDKDGSTPGVLTVSVDVAALAGFTIEHVEFTVDVTHTYRGDLSYKLTSPYGTESKVISRIDPFEDLDNWRFMSVAHWGEEADGTWVLEITDSAADDEGTLDSWSLDIHGRVITTSPPTISDIANQTILQDASPSAPVPFIVSDADTSLNLLLLSAESDTPSVITNGGIAFAGNGSHRTLTITPVAMATGTATITIRVDDGDDVASDDFVVSVEAGAPTVYFASASSSEFESVQFPTIPVQLSSWPGSDVTVGYYVSSGTAGGSDYSLSAGTLLFTLGSVSENLPLEIITDSLEELDETVKIALVDSTGAAVGAVWEHTYTIADDDTVPTVGFAQSTSSVDEGDGVLAVAVTLSQASGMVVQVEYIVAGGTAEGLGVDFGLPNGTLTFASGVTEQEILISIVDDGGDEENETIELSLQNPTNTALGAATDHVVTIVDNDTAGTPFTSPDRNTGCAPSNGGGRTLPTFAAVLLAIVAFSRKRHSLACRG